MSGEILMIAGGIIALCLALFFTVRPYLPSSLFAYGAIWLFDSGNVVYFSSQFLMSWGVITLISIVLDIMQPDKRWQPVTGSMYLVVGAVMGSMLGICVGDYWLIPGCIVCTALGAFAYSRTPGGKFLSLSRSTFIQYFCAYGFRVIVSIAMIGIIIGALVNKHLAENLVNIN